ncbi:MAG TPA: hypothetical protein VK728_17285 [Candidatus Sulfotelmatobacter sp.]|nr:hypothetical protein [Candidatus Sulfotelmatobacter sp.]
MTHLREWLLYVLTAALMIFTFVGSYLYAKHEGITEYTAVKWLNIFTTAFFAFGFAVKRFWHFRKRWTFWAELSVLIVTHFALLSRLHWEQASYFWLMVVVGLPELVVVYFLFGLMLDPHANLTEEDSP